MVGNKFVLFLVAFAIVANAQREYIEGLESFIAVPKCSSSDQSLGYCKDGMKKCYIEEGAQLALAPGATCHQEQMEPVDDDCFSSMIGDGFCNF
jgi:hypothetical protein